MDKCFLPELGSVKERYQDCSGHLISMDDIEDMELAAYVFNKTYLNCWFRF